MSASPAHDDLVAAGNNLCDHLKKACVEDTMCNLSTDKRGHSSFKAWFAAIDAWQSLFKAEVNEGGRTPLGEAAHSLYDHFGIDRYPGPHPYIQAIGEGADSIFIYLVREPMHFEKQVPETWEGFPVEKKVIGRISIGGY